MTGTSFALLAASLAIASTPEGPPDASPVLPNEIVVTAKRSGAPMWTIDTPSGAIILVGEIQAVPESTPWKLDLLEEAARESDRIILRATPKFSAGDVLRVIFAGGSITKLPDKAVAADYLDPDQRARLAALETKFDVDYDRRSFLMSAFDLLARRLDFDDETIDDATDVVRKAARRANVPTQRPERMRGEDLLDDLAEADPASHIQCLEAAMTATEAGPAIIQSRGEAWRSFAIPAVMSNPLEVALGSCWPWTDDDLGEEIRGQWIDMIAEAAKQPGTTLSVVPLRVLAEAGGVLDGLEDEGFVIYGPKWR